MYFPLGSIIFSILGLQYLDLISRYFILHFKLKNTFFPSLELFSVTDFSDEISTEENSFRHLYIITIEMPYSQLNDTTAISESRNQ